ncbi:SEC14 cytosolic factor [Amborella trichopoda]|uniref:CRAL-TRIO domain-containing protein n=1 Tax=Amborella trichopoda TaxID=13333 RepID=U5DIF8_AMBTC|nr:SEC14 cytosolic factor [Amborella trichopoda]ERN20368.1 hypothetical protein AMTR_s00068p00018710 [Amborella trichopoda]|eukprot:XP_006858901.1 SEC14 cytosolic factor [Amborella trichopoda]
MGWKEPKQSERVKAVLQILKKHGPLTVKQEKFCNDTCIERFLKAKGDSVKKAAKQLKACLAWRESIGTDHLTADEFSAELAEGAAYVAGQDEEGRPVMVFRIKQDHQKLHAQKRYIRLLVFTLEVAIASMSKNVEQFVLLFDAGFFRSASTYLNLLLATLKILSDHYPARLAKAFVVDPPTLFSYLWKGSRPFVDLWTQTAIISSDDFEEDDSFTSLPTRASSFRFCPPSSTAAAIATPNRLGACHSSRFSFTVSPLYSSPSIKPWYLDTVGSKRDHATSLGPALVSPLNARSFSFASPAARGKPLAQELKRGFINPIPNHINNNKHSFFTSPKIAAFFKKEVSQGGGAKEEGFEKFLRHYRAPYNEVAYRSKMKPPLGGLISIVAPGLRRRQFSFSPHYRC